MYDNNEWNKHDPQDTYELMQIQPQPLQQPQTLQAQEITPLKAPRRKRRRGNMRAILLCLFCLIFAASAGFVGGYLATSMRLDQTAYGVPMTLYGSESNHIESPLEHRSHLDELVGASIPAHMSAEAEDGQEDNQAAEISRLLSAFNRLDMNTAEVAAVVRHSVVEIKTETVTAGLWGGQRTNVGAGSGVIISDDGYIITNDHVINGAANISVRLTDGREFEARLIATDVRTDTAIIKIDATDLTPAVFGDSDKLAVGEGALAVGNPLGELGGTVTSGIISATHRDIALDGEIMTLLQTDAAVNPGNSGGGLFNMRGELIGVVVAKSGGINVEGLGFAIPSNTAQQVAGDLIAYGHVRGRADVGVSLVDISTTQLARQYGVNQLGLYILGSENESLLRGDRIVAMDNREITNQLSFNALLRHREVGETISLTVIRGGNEVTVAVTLVEWIP